MKQKTHKALSQRIRVTKTGKVLKRTAGQDHFNAKERGKTRRNKRSDKPFSTYRAAVKTLVPYETIK